MNNFKYIDNYSDSSGEILLYGKIGADGINGSDFANEMRFLESFCEKITVRINSEGGSVIDGYSVVSSLINCKVPVTTVNEGLAASTAGFCYMCGSTKKMRSHAILMFHSASGSDDKALINMVNGSICEILSQNSGKDKDYFLDLMNKKKDTYLSASDKDDLDFIIQNKFADEILPSKHKLKINKAMNLSELALIYNKINKPKMENIKNKLKLGVEATELEIVNAIEVFQNKVTELENSNKELSNKVAEFEAKETEKAEAEKAAFVAEVTETVEKAVKEDKIKAEEKESVLANALSSKENFAFVKNMLDKISNVVVAPVVFDLKNVKAANGIENREGWTCRDWEMKDPNGLLKLKNEAPAIYTMLFKAEYGVEPTI